MSEQANNIKKRLIKSLQREEQQLTADISRKQGEIIAAKKLIEDHQKAIQEHHNRILSIKEDIDQAEKLDLTN